MRTISRRHRFFGFTYLWVLFIVALMGGALSVAGEFESIAARREKERTLLAIGHQFRAAIGRYYESQLVAGKREYPASLEDLLKDKRFPEVRRYLRKIYVDPMTGKAEWGMVRIAGRVVGVHSNADVEPLKQGSFQPDDAGFSNKKKISEWVFMYPADAVLQKDASGQLVLPGSTQAGIPPPVQIDGKPVPKIGEPIVGGNGRAL